MTAYAKPTAGQRILEFFEQTIAPQNVENLRINANITVGYDKYE